MSHSESNGRPIAEHDGAASRRDIDTSASVDALRRIVRALRLAATGVEKTTGLSAAQLFVLQRVAEAPGSSLTELAERTLTDRTSVAAVVERLAARGLVDRTRSTADRRRVDVVATPLGAQLLGAAPHPPTMTFLDALRTVDDGDLRLIADGLRRLEQAMGVANEPAGMFFEDTSDTRAALPDSSPSEEMAG
jgi:MarR family transcriptional regulator, organic hydroperoxide resistance regulator